MKRVVHHPLGLIKNLLLVYRVGHNDFHLVQLFVEILEPTDHVLRVLGLGVVVKALKICFVLFRLIVVRLQEIVVRLQEGLHALDPLCRLRLEGLCDIVGVLLGLRREVAQQLRDLVVELGLEALGPEVQRAEAAIEVAALLARIIHCLASLLADLGLDGVDAACALDDPLAVVSALLLKAVNLGLKLAHDLSKRPLSRR